MKNKIKLLKNRKNVIVLTIFIFIFLVIIGMPTLAKLKNRNTIYDATAWDGTISTSYKKGDGSEEKPYIISNGSEFAYFIEQLKNTTYENKYFELSNDIIINPGMFDYTEDKKIKYTLNEETYYVKEFTNELYENENYDGNSIGKLNVLSTIKEFKGNFNGNSFTIFGLYLSDETEEELSLFQNLTGKVENLYLINSFVHGVDKVSGLVINSKDSIISNVSSEGIIISNAVSKEKELNIESFLIESYLTETNTNISLPQAEIKGKINSLKLIGNYEVEDKSATDIILINGQPVTSNSFEINLGNVLLNEFEVIVSSTIDDQRIKFSNLKLIIEYNDDISSGLIIDSADTVLKNVINKSDVYSNYLSVGMVGEVNGSFQLSAGYNTGDIISEYMSAGLIGEIENNSNNTTITNAYNTGNITSSIAAGLISKINENPGLVNINNSINVSSNYAINTVTNSDVNIIDSFSINGLTSYSGLSNGIFEQTNIENLYDETFMSEILYNKFISLLDVEKNQNNVWIFENDSMPILYIDDLNNPVAAINLNKYSWNNLSYELNSINLKNNITFSVDQLSETNPIKEKYYFISNSRQALTQSELNELKDWKRCDDIVKIEESGYYVIYAKIIDSKDQITYINTDIIALNKTGFIANIQLDEKEWNNFNTDSQIVYLNHQINATIDAFDELNGINSIQYYISNDEMTKEQLKNLADWKLYENGINISDLGEYIIYAKIINGESEIKYVNTDLLIYNGYSSNVNLGNKNINYNSNYITSDSSIQLHFESNFEIDFEDGYTHNLIVNSLLPVGTKITLIDSVTNKIYVLKIQTSDDIYGYNTSCIDKKNCSKFATYKFSDFKEIGVSGSKKYNESLNNNKLISNEKYIINIDFSNAEIIDDYYDFKVFLAIKDANDNLLYSTLENCIAGLNIYSKSKNSDLITDYLLTSDYQNQTIYYNSNSDTSISFNNLVLYSKVNEKSVIDTTFESKKIGLMIGLYNKSDEKITKEYLSNIIFELDGKEFFADENNDVKLILSGATDLISKKLKIKTKENSSNLENGEYYLKIINFISEDGYYYNELSTNDIKIPVIVEEQQPSVQNYNFSVQMNNDTIRINRKEKEHQAIFNINYNGLLSNPIIKLSLYEKKSFTAYNQEYVKVDLSKYVLDELIDAGSYDYLFDLQTANVSLNLEPSKFNNNGYKFVFELYDGENKVNLIEKYFIVN